MGTWKSYKKAVLPNTDVLSGMTQESLAALGLAPLECEEVTDINPVANAAAEHVKYFMSLTGGTAPECPNNTI